MEDLKGRKDPGRELGKRLVGYISGREDQHKDSDENTSLLSPSATDDEESTTKVQKQEAPPIWDAFTFQSTMNVVYYAFLALHSITFDQLLPVFLSYPPQDPSEWELPFKFAGGFGLPSSKVGKVFSVYGICGMILQVSSYWAGGYDAVAEVFLQVFYLPTCDKLARQPSLLENRGLRVANRLRPLAIGSSLATEYSDAGHLCTHVFQESL
jgi:hypothetical protein